jgi:hypothetical protein
MKNRFNEHRLFLSYALLVIGFLQLPSIPVVRTIRKGMVFQIPDRRPENFCGLVLKLAQ